MCRILPVTVHASWQHVKSDTSASPPPPSPHLKVAFSDRSKLKFWRIHSVVFLKVHTLCDADISQKGRGERRWRGNLPCLWTTGCRSCPSLDPQPQCSSSHTCVDTVCCCNYLRCQRLIPPPTRCRLSHTRYRAERKTWNHVGSVLLAPVWPVSVCVCSAAACCFHPGSSGCSLRCSPLLTAPAGYFTIFMLLSGAVGEMGVAPWTVQEHVI